MKDNFFEGEPTAIISIEVPQSFKQMMRESGKRIGRKLSKEGWMALIKYYKYKDKIDEWERERDV